MLCGWGEGALAAHLLKDLGLAREENKERSFNRDRHCSFCFAVPSSSSTPPRLTLLPVSYSLYTPFPFLYVQVALEAALCFASPWSSYYAAEALQLSGIVAILFCGIVMASYTRSNLSHHARELTTEMFECLAAIAEAFVFNYLGEGKGRVATRGGGD